MCERAPLAKPSSPSLVGKGDHLLAQRGEHQRRKIAHALRGLEGFHEGAHIAEGLAGFDPHAGERRDVRDADAGGTARLKVVDEGCGAGEVCRPARVDRLDARAEVDFA